MTRRKRRRFTIEHEAELVERMRRSGKGIVELDRMETSVRESAKRAEESETSSCVQLVPYKCRAWAVSR